MLRERERIQWLILDPEGESFADSRVRYYAPATIAVNARLEPTASSWVVSAGLALLPCSAQSMVDAVGRYGTVRSHKL